MEDWARTLWYERYTTTEEEAKNKQSIQLEFDQRYKQPLWDEFGGMDVEQTFEQTKEMDVDEEEDEDEDEDEHSDEEKHIAETEPAPTQEARRWREAVVKGKIKGKKVDEKYLLKYKFNFNKDPVESLSAKQFNAKYLETCEFIHKYLTSKNINSWNYTVSAKKYKHLYYLQALGVSAWECDHLMNQAYFIFIQNLCAHIVSKYDTKEKIEDDKVCYSPVKGLYVMDLQKFDWDKRVTYVMSQLNDIPIYQEICAVYGEHNVDIIDFGASLLKPNGADGRTHNDYEAVPVQGLSLFPFSIE